MGVSCFLANRFHSYLYDVHRRCRLLSSFSFMTKSRLASCDGRLLHALSDESVETYTSRVFQAAVSNLPRGSAVIPPSAEETDGWAESMGGAGSERGCGSGGEGEGREGRRGEGETASSEATEVFNHTNCLPPSPAGSGGSGDGVKVTPDPETWLRQVHLEYFIPPPGYFIPPPGYFIPPRLFYPTPRIFYPTQYILSHPRDILSHPVYFIPPPGYFIPPSIFYPTPGIFYPTQYILSHPQDILSHPVYFIPPPGYFIPPSIFYPTPRIFYPTPRIFYPTPGIFYFYLSLSLSLVSSLFHLTVSISRWSPAPSLSAAVTWQPVKITSSSSPRGRRTSRHHHPVPHGFCEICKNNFSKNFFCKLVFFFGKTSGLPIIL